jgi:hypothetical protein
LNYGLHKLFAHTPNPGLRHTTGIPAHRGGSKRRYSGTMSVSPAHFAGAGFSLAFKRIKGEHSPIWQPVPFRYLHPCLRAGRRLCEGQSKLRRLPPPNRMPAPA